MFNYKTSMREIKEGKRRDIPYPRLENIVIPPLS